MVARYHHLTDATQIEAFYADLFGWRFDPATGGPRGAKWPCWDICHADGDVIAHVEEVPQEVRRTYRYWIPCFACNVGPNPQGMTRLSDLGDGRVIYADRQGASFMLRNEP